MLNSMLSKQQLTDSEIQSQHREHLSQNFKTKMAALDAATAAFEQASSRLNAEPSKLLLTFQKEQAAQEMCLAAHQALVAFEYLQDANRFEARQLVAICTECPHPVSMHRDGVCGVNT